MIELEQKQHGSSPELLEKRPCFFASLNGTTPMRTLGTDHGAELRQLAIKEANFQPSEVAEFRATGTMVSCRSSLVVNYKMGHNHMVDRC